MFVLSLQIMTEFMKLKTLLLLFLVLRCSTNVWAGVKTYKSLDDALKNPQAVVRLKLRNIDSIPATIALLINLEELDLSRNHLKQLPEEIGELKKLKELVLFKNNLTSLPASIGSCSNLERLVLSSNRIKVLPETIGKLSRLKELSIKSNVLESLPNSIDGCYELRRLFLDYNQLSTLPATLGNLPHLDMLTIERNSITYLPDELGNCTSITFLNISRNQLQIFPPGICKLQNLQVLDVAYCGVIGALPDCIRNFRALDRFYIDNRVSIPMSLTSRTRPQVIIKQ